MREIYSAEESLTRLLHEPGFGTEDITSVLERHKTVLVSEIGSFSDAFDHILADLIIDEPNEESGSHLPPKDPTHSSRKSYILAPTNLNYSQPSVQN